MTLYRLQRYREVVEDKDSAMRVLRKAYESRLEYRIDIEPKEKEIKEFIKWYEYFWEEIVKSCDIEVRYGDKEWKEGFVQARRYTRGVYIYSQGEVGVEEVSEDGRLWVINSISEREKERRRKHQIYIEVRGERGEERFIIRGAKTDEDFEYQISHPFCVPRFWVSGHERYGRFVCYPMLSKHCVAGLLKVYSEYKGGRSMVSREEKVKIGIGDTGYMHSQECMKRGCREVMVTDREEGKIYVICLECEEVIGSIDLREYERVDRLVDYFD